jgi:glycosyltransferase involved in cell wall biosynthesis
MNKAGDMAKLCTVTSCKGRLDHLKQSLPRMAGQPGVSSVVVDFSCPQETGDWVETNFPKVRVVRVEGEPLFSRSRSRNLGAAVADAEWLAFVDADVILDPAFAKKVLPLLKPGHYYRAHPISDLLYGFIIVRRADFEAAGGYDEIYEGWGAEDIDLMDAFDAAGLRQAYFPGELLLAIPHSNEMRTLYQDIQSIWLQDQINNVYRHLKYDLRRILGRSLSAREAKPIYAEVVRLLNQTAERDRFAPTWIRINLADLDIIHGKVVGAGETTRIESSLLYKVQPLRPSTAEPAA